MPDEEVHKNRTEARAASSPNVVRWILASSLGLLIIIYAIILLVRA